MTMKMCAIEAMKMCAIGPTPNSNFVKAATELNAMGPGTAVALPGDLASIQAYQG